MYTVYQLVSRIPLPTSLTLAHLPPGGRVNSPINGNLAHRIDTKQARRDGQCQKFLN